MKDWHKQDLLSWKRINAVCLTIFFGVLVHSLHDTFHIFHLMVNVHVAAIWITLFQKIFRQRSVWFEDSAAFVYWKQTNKFKNFPTLVQQFAWRLL